MLFTKNDEYVLLGHPDKITDGIAETIAMSIYNLDGLEGRSAVEAVYSGSSFTLGGEFKTSLSDTNFKKLVEWIVETITSKQTKNKVKVSFQHMKQSPELTRDSLEGWTDNCIAYGYYNHETKTNKTPARVELEKLGEVITEFHKKELPDGKLIHIEEETTISIESGILEKGLKLLGVKNPTIFKKSGADADSGTVGRKLIAERHGNGVPHGGGAFVGKDFTKADKTFKLLADMIAEDQSYRYKDTGNSYEEKEHVLVQLAIKHGLKKPSIRINCERQDQFIFESNTSFEDALDPNRLKEMYRKYAPVKPSMYLNDEDIEKLEELLLKLSGKEELEHRLW